MGFQYNIGQRVSIVGFDSVGVVRAVFVTEDGVDFDVLYKDNTGRFDNRWFKTSQLSGIPTALKKAAKKSKARKK